MGLDAILSHPMSTAKDITRDQQVDVVHRPARAPGAAIDRRAIVDQVVRRFQGADSVERLSRARVTFLDDVSIRESDSLVLPDGTTGPILQVERLLAPVGGGFFVVVWLGAA